MSEPFFKFPHTPHLFWLGREPPRADKVLSAEEAQAFLAGDLSIDEKVDGANIGLSLDHHGELRVQNRGAYLGRGDQPQFRLLGAWLDARRESLTDALHPGLILFGEWCFAVHTVRYDCLPDWFLGFDVYEPSARRFWSTERRNAWLSELGLAQVPLLVRGRFSRMDLLQMSAASRLGQGPMEGLYLRRDEGPWLGARAKVVRPEFVQSIEEHWSRRRMEKNRLKGPRTP